MFRRTERTIKERREAISREIRQLINDGLILPPATHKLDKGVVIDESIRDEEELSDNDICI